MHIPSLVPYIEEGEAGDETEDDEAETDDDEKGHEGSLIPVLDEVEDGEGVQDNPLHDAADEDEGIGHGPGMSGDEEQVGSNTDQSTEDEGGKSGDDVSPDEGLDHSCTPFDVDGFIC